VNVGYGRRAYCTPFDCFHSTFFHEGNFSNSERCTPITLKNSWSDMELVSGFRFEEELMGNDDFPNDSLLGEVGDDVPFPVFGPSNVTVFGTKLLTPVVEGESDDGFLIGEVGACCCDFFVGSANVEKDFVVVVAEGEDVANREESFTDMREATAAVGANGVPASDPAKRALGFTEYRLVSGLPNFPASANAAKRSASDFPPVMDCLRTTCETGRDVAAALTAGVEA
jgi:hypothetical protein